MAHQHKIDHSVPQMARSYQKAFNLCIKRNH